MKKFNQNSKNPSFLIYGLFFYLIFQILFFIHLRIDLVDFLWFFDSWDIDVYFQQAQWVFSHKRLYYDIFSEYPILANFIFSGLFLLVLPFKGLIDLQAAYSFLWVLKTSLILGFLYKRCKIHNPTLKYLFFVPSFLFFGLLRFDIYLALLTVFLFEGIQEKNFKKASLSLGLGIALKGYMLLFVPLYLLYLIKNEYGKRTFLKSAIFLALPNFLSLLISYIGWGLYGLKAPYLTHLYRYPNRETIWDAIIYLSQFAGIIFPQEVQSWGLWKLSSQVSLALIVLLSLIRIPESVEGLMKRYIFIIMGFILFNYFTSPQYIVWIFPLIFLLKDRTFTNWMVAFGFATYLYYPIVFHSTAYSSVRAPIFESFIVLFTLFKLIMFVGLGRKSFSTPFSTQSN